MCISSGKVHVCVLAQGRYSMCISSGKVCVLAQRRYSMCISSGKVCVLAQGRCVY